MIRTDNIINQKNKMSKSSKKINKTKTILKQIRKNVLLLLTLISVVLAILVGFMLKNFFKFNDNEISYFGFCGELFLRMLKFLILPLITTSLISGIAGLGAKNAGKIGFRALCYYFSTTIIAVLIGICLVTLIKPGVGKETSTNDALKVPIDTKRIINTHDTLLDLIRNVFPDNLIEMGFREYETNYVPQYNWLLVFNNGENQTLSELPKGFMSKNCY